MGLPVPNLDDKKFDELLEEARLLIARYAKEEWTDHNIHDPGITFIELFAWLAEMQIYQLNQVTDAHYRKFLALVGLYPATAQPGRVEISFEEANHEQVNLGQTIPAGTKLVTNVGTEKVVFETEDEFTLIAAKLERVVTIQDTQTIDNTEANRQGNISFTPFGEKAHEGALLKLGFDHRLPEKRIHITIDVDDKELPPVGSHGDEPAHVHPSVIVNWEYLSGEEWKPLTIYREACFGAQSYNDVLEDFPVVKKILQPLARQEYGKVCIDLNRLTEDQKQDLGKALDLIMKQDNADSILALTRNGSIVFQGPSDMDPDPHDGLYWIRCRLQEGRYEIVPRINRILLNTFPVVQTETIRNENLQTGSGIPGQKLLLKKTPVIKGSQHIQVRNEKDEWMGWEEVVDFELSGPDDVHYTFDPEKGEITFGNGLNGRLPQPPETIRAALYKTTLGSKGNIQKGQRFLFDGFTGRNRYQATGGKDAESIDHAKARARKDLRTRYRAITPADFEELAISTPGLRVARAKALSDYHPEFPCVDGFPGAVTVVVVPHVRPGGATPIPGNGFIRSVAEHLNNHRLVTTDLHVVRPEYVKISVQCDINIRKKSDAAILKQRVQEALHSFLDPLKGGPDGEGWPFGRAVYPSEIYQVIDKLEGVDYAKGVTLEAEGNFKKEGEIIKIPKVALVYSGEHKIRDTEALSVDFSAPCKTRHLSSNQ